jgi:hypothetical protein
VLLLAGAGVTTFVRFRPADEAPDPAGTDIVLEDLPGIRQPPALPAGAAHLRDNTEVIGVAAAGRHRAYVIDALVRREQHVVNDQLGGAPVTVTYCDRTDCARVFTDARGGGPLDVASGGWVGRYEEGCMLLRVGSDRYRQDTGLPLAKDAPPFPLARAEFVRTTWKEWREAHPDTDVYVGEPPSVPGSAAENVR